MQEQGRERRVVITGIGTINALGHDVREYWDGLKSGRSGVRRIRNFNAENYSVQIGAEIDLHDIRGYFKSPKMIRRLDRYTILSQVAGVQAFRDSGLDVQGIAHRCGAILGVGSGGLEAHLSNIPHMISGHYQEVSPFYVVGCIPSTGTAYFVQETGLEGPSFSVNSACSTGNHALGLAAMFIKSGMTDVMFAGGTEATLNITGLTGFGNIMALSNRNDSPQTASRPFDRDRNGFVLGEGAGVLCLEELEHARRRGGRIYAEFSGFGFSSDAHDLVAPHPEGKAAVAAIKLALESASLTPQDIDLVNCHGTSTPLGDRIEGMVMEKALGSHGRSVPVHSTKSMVGHLLGGASAVEAIAALMVFSEGVIHKSVNLFHQDPEIRLNVLTENADGSKVNHILSNAFGFGGMNAVVILSRYRP